MDIAQNNSLELIVKRVGIGGIVMCSITALFQWTLALYRLSLYDGRPYLNHSDDFSTIYLFDAFAVPLGLICVALLWRFRKLRTFALVVVAVNLLGALAFLLMHRMGVLVTYDEFIQHWMR